MSLINEQSNLVNTDDTRIFDPQQQSLFINTIHSSEQQNLPSSVITTAHLTPVTYRNQNQYSITASVPHQPHLNTIINLSQEFNRKI